MPGILFDLDGVFYVGEQAIPGGMATLDWVRAENIPHLFLTNTSSRPRSALVTKLAGFGIDTDPAHILTPPVAARRWLRQNVSGCSVLFVSKATEAEFSSIPLISRDSAEPTAAVVIGDLGDGWDYATMNAAFRHLHTQPTPALVALGMTRFWCAEDGLRLDVGPIVEALRYASGVQPVVMGKPAPAFFEAALDILGLPATETVMVGDDIRGDVGGAQNAGITAVQVRTGKFQAADLLGDIRADAVIDSIASLPNWWRTHYSG
ncbi:MAG: TIGR01458 family HAD-type hydrolase [Gammaproteobacteria bacterium]|nr:TIGR01458 family HAD-type hydrolase [Gammaproteobacteria bacterium]MCP5136438.1 TIGR01458 family HAD-type hydrolase [Gammaproteobacteria bacterium]